MKQYAVTGMACAACSARVEKAVSRVEGVSSCSVNLLTKSMGVEGDVPDSVIIQAVVDATAKMLKENKDTFVKIMTDAYDKVDVKDIIENTVDELVDKLASASGKDVSDEDKQTLKDQLMSTIDVSDIEVSKEDIESSIDDTVKKLEDTKIADEDVDGKADVNVYKEDGAYIAEMEMDVTEDGEASSATIKSTIKEDSSVKVDVPTDAASLVDIIVNLYASYLENIAD